MFEKSCKTSLSIAVFAGSLLAAVTPGSFASAEDSSPYLIGHWKLNDSFSDFKPPGSEIRTENTEFVFLNPTNLKLTLEYAFFATVDTDINKKAIFCGCDRDVLSPNGRTRYTMLGEKQTGPFSTQLCPTQTEGDMKTIVFQGSSPPNTPGNELQAGYQIDLSPNVRTEAPLLAVTINDATKAEIQSIHAACVGFITPSATKKHP